MLVPALLRTPAEDDTDYPRAAKAGSRRINKRLPKTLTAPVADLREGHLT